MLCTHTCCVVLDIDTTAVYFPVCFDLGITMKSSARSIFLQMQSHRQNQDFNSQTREPGNLSGFSMKTRHFILLTFSIACLAGRILLFMFLWVSMILLLWSEGDLKSQAFLPQPSNGGLYLRPLQLHKSEELAAILQFCMLTSLSIKGRWSNLRAPKSPQQLSFGLITPPAQKHQLWVPSAARLSA